MIVVHSDVHTCEIIYRASLNFTPSTTLSISGSSRNVAWHNALWWVNPLIYPFRREIPRKNGAIPYPFPAIRLEEEGWLWENPVDSPIVIYYQNYTKSNAELSEFYITSWIAVRKNSDKIQYLISEEGDSFGISWEFVTVACRSLLPKLQATL